MATNAVLSSSLYDVLGIPVSSNRNEIKSAYRRLARTCHPDVVSVSQKEMSANEFMKIHAAYCTLSDPYKRSNYDRDLFIRRKQPAPAVMASRFSGYNYTSRNWETDQCW